MSPDDSAAFEAIFHETSPRVFAYAARHAGFSDADDVVAETYAVAWRRFSAIPADPLPWLLVTARNAVRNQSRSQRRSEANWTAVVRDLWHATTAVSPDTVVEARETAIEALRSCTDQEREALLLVAWDGLTEYLELPAPPADWAPAAVAEFPTDPAELRQFFSDRVSGSLTHDEAIFNGVHEVLIRGYAPPAVQQAAIEALAELDVVTVQRAKAPSGRALLEVRFYDPKTRGPEAFSMWFDESTGRLAETSSVLTKTGQINYATYAPGSLVDAVPADVLALANDMSGDQPPAHEPTPQPSPSCA